MGQELLTSFERRDDSRVAQHDLGRNVAVGPRGPARAEPVGDEDLPGLLGCRAPEVFACELVRVLGGRLSGVNPRQCSQFQVCHDFHPLLTSTQRRINSSNSPGRAGSGKRELPNSGLCTRGLIKRIDELARRPVRGGTREAQPSAALATHARRGDPSG